jgi:hypothetical protein
MSNQNRVEGTIHLTDEGVKIVQMYNDIKMYKTDRERWSVVGDTFPAAAKYGSNDRSDFIPFGTYFGVHPESKLEGNVWEILCSTSNMGDEIEAFLNDLLPVIATDIDIEVTPDFCSGTRYKLVDGLPVGEIIKPYYNDWDY